jgi:hypothetical protein
MVMPIEDRAELRVDRDLADAEGGGEVVGLVSTLEAALELKKRGVLDEKESEARKKTIAQRVADFAELAGVGDAGDEVSDGVDEGAKTK